MCTQEVLRTRDGQQTQFSRVLSDDAVSFHRLHRQVPFAEKTRKGASHVSKQWATGAILYDCAFANARFTILQLYNTKLSCIDYAAGLEGEHRPEGVYD